LVSFLYFVCIYSRSAAVSFLLPIVGRDEANLSIQAIGVLLGSAMLLNMVATLPAGLLADRFGARRVLLGGLILLMMGETLILLIPNGSGLAMAAVFFGLAGPSSSLTYALFGEISRESSSPRSLGGFRLSGDSGAVLGPLSMGLLLGQLGYRPALLTVLAVGSLALSFLAREIWFGRQVEVVLEPGR
jgi:MFS family permease